MAFWEIMSTGGKIRLLSGESYSRGLLNLHKHHGQTEAQGSTLLL